MNCKEIRAVLFDLDGTLADTILDLGNSVNTILGNHGYSGYPIEDYKMMVGNGFPKLFDRALPQSVPRDSEEFDTIVEEAKNLYHRESLVYTKSFPGIVSMLASLKEKGIACAVLSNKPDPMTKTIVKNLFPGYPFFAIQGDSPGLPQKPDPTKALAIVASSSIPLCHWAFVGDSGVDMQTGLASGMISIGVLWGYRSAEELKEAGASYLFASPKALAASL